MLGLQRLDLLLQSEVLLRNLVDEDSHGASAVGANLTAVRGFLQHYLEDHVLIRVDALICNLVAICLFERHLVLHELRNQFHLVLLRSIEAELFAHWPELDVLSGARWACDHLGHDRAADLAATAVRAHDFQLDLLIKLGDADLGLLEADSGLLAFCLLGLECGVLSRQFVELLLQSGLFLRDLDNFLADLLLRLQFGISCLQGLLDFLGLHLGLFVFGLELPLEHFNLLLEAGNLVVLFLKVGHILISACLSLLVLFLDFLLKLFALLVGSLILLLQLLDHSLSFLLCILLFLILLTLNLLDLCNELSFLFCPLLLLFIELAFFRVEVGRLTFELLFLFL